MITPFRVVIDTNVLLAAQSGGINSPGKEIFDCWKNNCFQTIYSLDVLREYISKMEESKIPDEEIINVASSFMGKAEEIFIRHYHYPYYADPADPDDIAFVLCAGNGNATHLVSYDKHLLEKNAYFEFQICEPVPFLKELRMSPLRKLFFGTSKVSW